MNINQETPKVSTPQNQEELFRTWIAWMKENPNWVEELRCDQKSTDINVSTDDRKYPAL